LTTIIPPALLSLTVAFHGEGAEPIAGGIVAGKVCLDSSPRRSKQPEQSRMNTFDNPFDRGRNIDHSERVAAIKLWTRQTLALAEESTVSVSQFGCAKPTCPRNLTAILVMSQDAPARKITIHKSIVDVGEDDVVDAWSELLHSSPS
jgi:hypothetical protein